MKKFLMLTSVIATVAVVGVGGVVVGVPYYHFIQEDNCVGRWALTSYKGIYRPGLGCFVAINGDLFPEDTVRR